MAATLNQIAALANIHPSTVSLVLNGRQHHRVSRETRLKIERIAGELNYRANRHAQGLSRGQTRTVAVLLNQFTNPFFGQYVSLLETRFEAVGYHVSPFETRADIERERELMSLCSQGTCDVTVSLAHYLVEAEAEDQPVVVRILDFLGTASERCPLSHVVIDYQPAMQELIAHLDGQGYRRLGLILHRGNQPFPPRVGESRYATLLRGLVERSSLRCGLQQQAVAHERDPMATWFEAATTLLTRDPEIDVLLVHSMEQVLPIVEAATRLGRKIGKDLGIATFDDPPAAEWLGGGITVIREPAAQVADALAELAIARIEGRTEKQSRRIQAELVTRASTNAIDLGR